MQNDDFDFNFDDDFVDDLGNDFVDDLASAEEQPENSNRSTRSAIDDYEAYSQDDNLEASGSGALKYILLAVAAVLIVAVLIVLCVRIGRSGKSSAADVTIDADVTSFLTVRDSYGKDMSGNLSVTAGVTAPSDVNANDALLLDLTWTGKDAAEYPMIITISDPSFEDGDGLVVFQYAGGQWTQLETYLIADHAVTFMVNELGSFAFIPYSKFATPAPTASPTPTIKPTPTPTPKPSSSPSPSPTATSNNSSTTNSGTYTSATPAVVATADPNYNNNNSADGNSSVVIEEPDDSTDDTGGGDTGGGDSGGGDSGGGDSGGGDSGGGDSGGGDSGGGDSGGGTDSGSSGDATVYTDES